jgi:hypothetical protein
MNQDSKSVFTKLPSSLKYRSISFLQYGELKFLERINKENKELVQNFSDQKQYREHVAALDITLPDSYGIYTALECIERLSSEIEKIKTIKCNQRLGLSLFASTGLLTFGSVAIRSWLQQLHSLRAEWSIVNVTINNITQSCKDYVAPVVANLTRTQDYCTLGEDKCAFDYSCEILNGKNETLDCRNLFGDILKLADCGNRVLYSVPMIAGGLGVIVFGRWLTYRLWNKPEYLCTISDLPIKVVKKLFKIYSRNFFNPDIDAVEFNKMSIKALRNSLESLLSNNSQQNRNEPSLVEETIVDIGPGSLQQRLLG